MTHELKVWPQYFEHIRDGVKNFELRKDDRPFKVGDTLLLQEYGTKESGYNGDEIKKVVTYILRDATKFGLMKGFCILGLSDPSS